MIRYSSLESIPGIYLYSYYAIVLISFLHLLIKYKGSLFNTFVIFITYPGLFACFSFLEGGYKIFILFLALILALKKKAITPSYIIKYRWMVGAFILFSCSFLYSGYFNRDDFFLIFSQYSKYLIVFLSFFIIRNEFENNPNSIPSNIEFIFNLILVQIFLSFAKLIFIGTLESIVGSISYEGGALGTVFPIAGFIFLWTIRNGKLNTKDWLIILGLFMVGFASDKRAIWFILPVIIFLFSTFATKKKKSFQLLPLISLLPVIFYFGVRLTPTLNSENEVWGSYDFDYVMAFAENYMFGGQDAEGIGRGGATILLIGKFAMGIFTPNDLYGYGLEKFNTSNYEEFASYGFGIQSKGAAAGFFQTYVGCGFVGVFMTLLFFRSVFKAVKIKGYTNIIIGIAIWEYFLYAGMIFRIQIIMFILIFCINLRSYYLNLGLKKVTESKGSNSKIAVKQ